jgi:hypothetical protein
VLATATGTALALSLLASVPPARAAPTTATQSFATSGVYSWVVPVGVSSLDVTAVGGAGGAGAGGTPFGGAGGTGGLGASVEDSALAVTPGETLTIVVGDPGAAAGASGPGAGGPFGGGASAGGGGASNALGGGAGGGGSSVWQASDTNQLMAPLVVAGGGGGGGAGLVNNGGSGGNAGGSAGTAGVSATGGGGGGGGTSTAGGAGGTAGTGGNVGGAGGYLSGGQGAGAASSSAGAGGGGGGYYGGGGGGTGGSSTAAGGGGGGSSFVVAPGTLSATTTSNPPSVTITYLAPTATVTPGTVSFGSITTGTASAEQMITVANNGSAPLSVLGTSLFGARAADYLVEDLCTQPVAPSASCQVGVRFTPGRTGASSASLLIFTSAQSAPPPVTLQGTGTAPVAPLRITSVIKLDVFAFGPSVKNRRVKLGYVLTTTASVALIVTPAHGKPVTVARTHGRAGTNQITWNGKLKGKRVKPGRYKLTLTATSNGKTSSSSVKIRL